MEPSSASRFNCGGVVQEGTWRTAGGEGVGGVAIERRFGMRKSLRLSELGNWCWEEELCWGGGDGLGGLDWGGGDGLGGLDWGGGDGLGGLDWGGGDGLGGLDWGGGDGLGGLDWGGGDGLGGSDWGRGKT